MLEKRDFFINGEWVKSQGGTDHLVIDPSTEEPTAVITLGSEADTNAAVAAAKAALPAWMATPVEERIAYVSKLIEVYESRVEDLAVAMSAEMGAPISMSRTSQVGAGSYHLKNFIRAAKGFEFSRPLGSHAPNDRIIYEPVGVAALITPWNWPMNQVTLKVGAAAIAGCTMVLKPSEESPINAMVFAEMMEEAGFPAGVFNMLNGDGVGVGSTLSGHKDVDMVSFTGSTRAGTLISKNAADTLKRVHLELGGKGANLVVGPFLKNDKNKSLCKGFQTGSCKSRPGGFRSAALLDPMPELCCLFSHFSVYAKLCIDLFMDISHIFGNFLVKIWILSCLSGTGP
jgi:aldehyde dehydrogenase (NAD+)